MVDNLFIVEEVCLNQEMRTFFAVDLRRRWFLPHLTVGIGKTPCDRLGSIAQITQTRHRKMSAG